MLEAGLRQLLLPLMAWQQMPASESTIVLMDAFVLDELLLALYRGFAFFPW